MDSGIFVEGRMEDSRHSFSLGSWGDFNFVRKIKKNCERNQSIVYHTRQEKVTKSQRRVVFTCSFDLLPELYKHEYM